MPFTFTIWKLPVCCTRASLSSFRSSFTNISIYYEYRLMDSWFFNRIQFISVLNYFKIQTVSEGPWFLSVDQRSCISDLDSSCAHGYWAISGWWPFLRTELGNICIYKHTQILMHTHVHYFYWSIIDITLVSGMQYNDSIFVSIAQWSQ